ncbi:GGDEF domain-containing protein [Catellatospora citrea]|uniref:GGDEF domain-containing protein n=1 Tax=Catellatospora citrea TaxID=53366 RepID=UPI0033F252C4
MSGATYLVRGAVILAVLLAVVLGYRIGTRANARLRLALDAAVRTASHDELTGLPNRRALRQRLAVLTASRSEIVLAIVNLDRFSAVNELGHRIGDQLLVHHAGQLRYHAAQAGGTAYRLGLDGFAIVWPAAADNAETLVNMLLDALRDPVELLVHNHPVVARVTTSAGVITLTGSGFGDQTSLLLSRANTALQHAKRTARGTAVHWQPQMPRLLRPQRADRATG